MIDPTRIRWLFFDVGDTLLDETDSMPDWCAQLAAELTRRGVHASPTDVLNARIQANTEFAPNILDRLLEILAPEMNDRTIFSKPKYRHDLERPSDGATEVLCQLSARFKLGVIANQFAGTAQRLCQHGWQDLISLCISSTEEGLQKPDPAIFRLALDRARCSPDQAVMIGDRIDNDIRPAKSIGMATVRFRHGISRFQQPTGPQDEADATIDSLRELPPLLL